MKYVEKNSLWYCEQKNIYYTTLTQYAQSMENNTINIKDTHQIQNIIQLS